jgi:hypothetical protein
LFQFHQSNEVLTPNNRDNRSDDERQEGSESNVFEYIEQMTRLT